MNHACCSSFSQPMPIGSPYSSKATSILQLPVVGMGPFSMTYNPMILSSRDVGDLEVNAMLSPVKLGFETSLKT